jgi:(p)ppGpp synthase/HD superfamily hydrolase
MSQLKKALLFATRAHAGQLRKYGNNIPYIMHPISVALRASEYGLPLETQQAAILHDVLEDTPTTVEDLSREGFSPYVIALVVQLTNPSHNEVNKNKLRAERKAIDRAHLADVSKYAKALKMIDRMDNLEDLAETDQATHKFKKLYLDESKLLFPLICDANQDIAMDLSCVICKMENELNGKV